MTQRSSPGLSTEAHRQFGFDNVMAGWGDILIEEHAHGSRWKFTDPRFYPRPDGYVPIDRAADIEPVDPLQDEFWSVPVRAARIMSESIGRDVAVVGCINSPMVIASEIVGMENLVMAQFQERTGWPTSSAPSRRAQGHTARRSRR